MMYAMMFAMPLIQWGMLFGGTVSDRALWTAASASDPAAQSDTIRGPAQDPHYSSHTCSSRPSLRISARFYFTRLIMRDHLIDRMVPWKAR